jgi:hypothetical protein
VISSHTNPADCADDEVKVIERRYLLRLETATDIEQETKEAGLIRYALSSLFVPFAKQGLVADLRRTASLFAR